MLLPIRAADPCHPIFREITGPLRHAHDLPIEPTFTSSHHEHNVSFTQCEQVSVAVLDLVCGETVRHARHETLLLASNHRCLATGVSGNALAAASGSAADTSHVGVDGGPHGSETLPVTSSVVADCCAAE
eukprot:CAMPEP_0117580820 /NCGR_PEP_ID=MMETSP0784-20121206/65440_1 /TAXON_ID=39447 /ORGANISM="" /LENGTH=129 /DNA_ID=CAMNT_0005380975 /DNA_START=85 /DNA_END=475 /DNA_ORIENTATION=+